MKKRKLKKKKAFVIHLKFKLIGYMKKNKGKKEKSFLIHLKF